MNLQINLELNSQEIIVARKLLAEMTANNTFLTLPFEAFMIIEKLTKATERELKIKLEQKRVSKKLDKMQEWARDRCQCGHEAREHCSSGEGLCCAEGCSTCFQFVKK